MSNPIIKDAQRKSALQIRSHLTASQQQESSKKVCQHIRELEAYRQAKRIALYHAFNQEIDLNDIWHTAPLHGKFCYFPVITENQDLLFLPATPKTLFEKNKYGIPEPQVTHENAISDNQLDIIFLPMVGFDILGTRLGMGKGYYDRSLSTDSKTLRIGVGYEFQKMDLIPRDPWDVTMDMIITESDLYIPL